MFHVQFVIFQNWRDCRSTQVCFHCTFIDVFIEFVFCHCFRWKANRASFFLVDVNLNPRTAHAYLYISEDRKEVRHANKRQEVPENPKRFDRVANVMSKEAFSYGKHLWEVEVGDKTDWDLGVAKQSVNRKGKFTICPANGFWMLSLKNGTQYIANTSPPTFFSLSHKPKRLSIYLDFEEGRVSFYCLDTGTHIYTFKDTFTDKLHPIFSPGRPHGEKNTAPLIISSSCCSIWNNMLALTALSLSFPLPS